MKKTMLVMAMVLALAMSTMAGAFADGHTGITSPSDGEMIIANTLELRANEPNADGEVAWAVRSAKDNENCDFSSETPDLVGWRGGEFQNDDINNVIEVSWDGNIFEADINVAGWERGEYCFTFNPEPFGNFRDSVTFHLATPSSKDACKDGGWMTNFAQDTYKNQGQCVSEFARMK